MALAFQAVDPDGKKMALSGGIDRLTVESPKPYIAQLVSAKLADMVVTAFGLLRISGFEIDEQRQDRSSYWPCGGC